MTEKKKINKNILLLLFGRFISDTGSTMQMVVIPLYIIDIGGSASTIGVFSFLSLMPAMLILPFAGVIGDRNNRKKIMISADIISALAILVLVIVSIIGNMTLPLLLGMIVVVYICYGFFSPASGGMIPKLVHVDDLNKTNSQVASLRMLSSLFGPLIGAVLYTEFGITVLFVINAVSFLLSGITEMFIQYSHEQRDDSVKGQSVLRDLKDGASFIFNHKLIRNLSLFFFLIFIFIQPVFGVALPLFFKTMLKYSDTVYGQIQMAIVAGSLTGTILAGILGKKGSLKKSLNLGVFIMAVSVIMITAVLTPRAVSLLGNDTILYLVFLFGVLFILGIGMMIIAIPVQTLIQKATPNEYMSRVFSIVGIISKGGMPLGALAYGIILDKFAIHWTMFVSSLLIVIISSVFVLLNKGDGETGKIPESAPVR